MNTRLLVILDAAKGLRTISIIFVNSTKIQGNSQLKQES